MEPQLRVCIAGAALDTSNHGVSALCLSTLAGFIRREPTTELTVFDNGRGVRETTFEVDGRDVPVRLVGARASKRLYRRDTLWVIRASGWLGGLGNPAIRAIRQADAVLDVSGGDSFTDLYGLRVFKSINMLKRITIEQGTPLILLPQTYGPYSAPEVRAEAERLIRRAHVAWARDERSFAELKERLGSDFDPERHRCGVDVAFGLVPRFPVGRLGADIEAWLQPEAEVPTVGFNVSGLIHNHPEQAALQYGLTIDYRRAVREILGGILDESDCNVLLVPHVTTPPGHRESDPEACQVVADDLEREHPGRVRVCPSGLDASDLKGAISRLDWFCGTRMHSTIASLSTGVPTATLAYSGKAMGVFESIGQGAHVADSRALDTETAVAQVLRSFREREHARRELAAGWQAFRPRVDGQMDAIVETCRRLRRRKAAG